MKRFAILLCIASVAAACEKPAPTDEPATDNTGSSESVADNQIVVRCGSVIDGLSSQPLGARLIVIRDTRIAEILLTTDASMANAEIIDLPNHTCLPGLIDMHVHLDGLPDDADDYRIYLQRTPDDTRRLSEELAGIVLDQGFTTVRHTGAYHAWIDRDLRERIESGAVRGPRLQIAGPYLTIPRGGGDMYIPGVPDEQIPAYYRMGVAKGPIAFRKRAEEVVAGGADFIKMIASGAVFGHGGDPGAPEMSPDEIRAVVEVARAAGIKTTAHAHSAQSIKDAILAGVDAIEHASFADDESIALAVEHGVTFSMDVYNGTYTADVGVEKGYADEFMRKNEETTETQRVAFEKAVNAGVNLVFGTDLGVLAHDLGARQFEVMVERGMTPMQAIRSATSVAAEHLGWQADVGAIEVGRFGDLVAVRGNPLRDIGLLQEIELVIKGGRIVRNDVAETSLYADSVYHTGKIYTVNDEQPWAQAIAISNGRIVFVGSDDRVRRYIGAETETYDLRGKMMLPGFQDAHVHPIYSGLEHQSCYLGDGADIADYRAIIAECAERLGDKEWITGGGWSMAAFGPGALASKSIIDELIPDTPVYLTTADGHSGWANSAALAAAGIDDNTPDPVDGIIDRDATTGEAIGSLQEGAMALVQAHIPEPTHEERLSALRFARDTMHRVGITSLQKAYGHEADLRVYQELDEAGELNLRATIAHWWENDQTEEQLDQLTELRARYTKGNVRATSVKIFIDGVMENYTALMVDPYLLDGDPRGVPMIDLDYLDEAVAAIDAAGFQVHFHALGDRAVREALDAVETALQRNGDSDRRHHLSHLQVIQPDDIPRFKALGAVANFQPLWASADEYITELTWPFISERTAQWMYPIKSVWDSGAVVAFGSDWSVSDVNPLPQIETAVTRKDAYTNDSPDMNPEQRISLERAIAGFTINAAYVNHQEDETGSIEVGKLADLVVLDSNLFDIEAAAISDASVVLTLFGGRPVFGDPREL